jgi:uncharacterized membrane protein
MKYFLLPLFGLCLPVFGTGFEKDVKPIFENYCVECHKGISKYEVAVGHKDKIYDKIVLKKEMPPNFRLKLSDHEVDIVKDWIESGTKK